MEGQDTVMNAYQIATLIKRHIKKHPAHEGFPLRGVVAKAQAGISFKAGYEKGLKEQGSPKADRVCQRIPQGLDRRL